ncbi:MAG TPA: hypothetical protein VFQ54_00580, partial [Thermomicrobiales bacterium]|nr:hypothetical protein [Thermomicrobiales bacterium]
MSHRRMRLTLSLIVVLLASTLSGGMPASAAAQSVSATHQRDISLDGTPVAISPDGKRIAGLGPDHTFCVWRISTRKATCSDEISSITPDTIRWAPDSSAVAFSQNAAINFVDSDIYVFDIASGKVKDVTDDSYDGNLSLDTDTETRATINVDINPGWSPDGKDLIFARTVWGTATGMGSQLMKVSRDGGDPVTLFTVAPPEPLVLWG